MPGMAEMSLALLKGLVGEGAALMLGSTTRKLFPSGARLVSSADFLKMSAHQPHHFEGDRDRPERTSVRIAPGDLGGFLLRVRFTSPGRSQPASGPSRNSESSAHTRHAVQVCPWFMSTPPARRRHAANANAGTSTRSTRVGQALFICRKCGVVAHADRNGSHNTAQRGAVVWNARRGSRVPATPGAGVWEEVTHSIEH